MDDGYGLRVHSAGMADDGTLWSQSSNLRPGLRVSPADLITVGSEDAVPSRAQVISGDIGHPQRWEEPWRSAACPSTTAAFDAVV